MKNIKEKTQFWPSGKGSERNLTKDQLNKIRCLISENIDDSTDSGRFLRRVLFSSKNEINWYWTAFHFSHLQPEHNQRLLNIIFNA